MKEHTKSYICTIETLCKGYPFKEIIEYYLKSLVCINGAQVMDGYKIKILDNEVQVSQTVAPILDMAEIPRVNLLLTGLKGKLLSFEVTSVKASYIVAEGKEEAEGWVLTLLPEGVFILRNAYNINYYEGGVLRFQYGHLLSIV